MWFAQRLGLPTCTSPISWTEGKLAVQDSQPYDPGRSLSLRPCFGDGNSAGRNDGLDIDNGIAKSPENRGKKEWGEFLKANRRRI